MYSVAVMMSTYNGEKYLREQIESILNQKDVSVYLYIRDDGSQDNTLEILNDYKKSNSNIFIEKGDNVGPAKSFMKCFYATPTIYDFYAFSDQDDIWYDNKLIEACKMLEANDEKEIYYCNSMLVDSFGKELDLRFHDIPEMSAFGVFCGENFAFGCHVVFSKSFKELIESDARRPDNSLFDRRMHDVWFSLIGLITNSIIYDERPFICYRQHDNNVVGAYGKSFKTVLKTRLAKLRNKERRNVRSLTASELVRKYGDYIVRYPEIERSADINTFKGKMNLIKHYKDFREYDSFIKFSLYVLLGLF